MEAPYANQPILQGYAPPPIVEINNQTRSIHHQVNEIKFGNM